MMFSVCLSQQEKYIPLEKRRACFRILVIDVPRQLQTILNIAILTPYHTALEM